MRESFPNRVKRGKRGERERERDSIPVEEEEIEGEALLIRALDCGRAPHQFLIEIGRAHV